MNAAEHDTEREVLELHRARLWEYAEQRRRLDVQERASRLIVEGLELELGEAATEPRAAESEPVGADSDPPLPPVVSDGDGPTMTARTAALRIMGETGGGWRSQALAEEALRRGWQIDAQRLVDAFRTALLRMEKDGQAVRVDRGVYALMTAPEATLTEGGGDAS